MTDQQETAREEYEAELTGDLEEENGQLIQRNILLGDEKNAYMKEIAQLKANAVIAWDEREQLREEIAQLNLSNEEQYADLLKYIAANGILDEKNAQLKLEIDEWKLDDVNNREEIAQLKLDVIRYKDSTAHWYSELHKERARWAALETALKENWDILLTDKGIPIKRIDLGLEALES